MELRSGAAILVVAVGSVMCGPTPPPAADNLYAAAESSRVRK